MFQFRQFPSYTYLIQCMIHGYESMWVSPFRNLRIKAYLQLPAAYRSLSRLSSAPSAKACALIRLTVFTDFRSEAVTRFSWFFFAHACFILRKYIKYSLTLQLRLNKKSSSKSSFLRSSRKSNPLILHLPTKKFSVFEIAVSNYIYFLSFAVTIQFSRCNLEDISNPISSHSTLYMAYTPYKRFACFDCIWNWWAQVDSNHRPRAYQARALTTWAMSPYWWR